MIKRIVLAGHAASGKDHARKVLESIGLEYGISYTTRPPRDGEVNGKDYHFLTKNQFERMIHKDKWYEYVTFNNWYYGTSNEQFHGGCQVFIMTPHGISLIKPEDRSETLIIFFNIPESIRRERLIGRNDNSDSIDRRMEADTKDFSKFIDWDIQVNDPKYDFVNDILNHDTFSNIEFSPEIADVINETFNAE